MPTLVLQSHTAPLPAPWYEGCVGSVRDWANRCGYDYRWQKFRERYLIANPFCEDCIEHGKVADATEIHHIEKLTDAPHKKFELQNLRALCNACHTSRTRRGQ